MINITVITVSYNCADLIESTINSVLEQDNIFLEYIIIDGGSTDGTVEVISKYISKIAYFKSESDLGIYDAMNKGIQKATGIWLLFLNAGDVFSPGFKFSNLSFNWPQNFEFVVFPYRVEGQPDVVMPILDSKTSLPSSHQATLFLSQIAKKTPFSLKYRVAADFDVYRRRRHLNANCVFGEQDVITVVKDGGFSCINRHIYISDYVRVILKYDGFLQAFVWYLRNNQVLFPVIKFAAPTLLFNRIKAYFNQT